MHRRVVGIRLVTGLIVAGGLLAGSLSPAQAGPSQLAVDEVSVRFVPCTEGSNPKKCRPITPEEPSKRGGTPKEDPPPPPEPPRPPRGGTINPPPSSPPEPPRGGRINEPRPDDDDRVTRVITTRSDSEPFVAEHQPIPNTADGVFLTVEQPTTQAAPQSVVVQSPRVQPVVYAAPSAGIGPEGGDLGMASALTALAALFGAGALYIWRRPMSGDRIA